ncbi:MAG TPA: MEDS domain-containing protein [Candidatus Thermoplasmatota archaeon]|nr:MEDS domain-containing protein [Candidatus Thermoplasmatota archaeon]
MSQSGWHGLLAEGGGAHIVQLYESPHELEDAIHVWLGASLRRGGAALLLGPRHVGDALRAPLEAAAPGAERDARLLILDGDALLAEFVRDGVADTERFERLVAPHLARVRAAAGGGEMRAWGALVDTLVKRGDREAARALEEAWNRIIAAHGIKLLCSYELRGGDEARARLVHDVADTHTHLHAPPRRDARS